MTRMPWKMYLPRFEKFWSGKIWNFTIFRDYGIQLDFREGNLITWILDDIKKRRWFDILRGRNN